MSSPTNQEIERKFLVRSDGWKNLAQGTRLRQGYLASSQNATVRIRSAGDVGFLTIKGTRIGITRREYEYEIPVAEADAMIEAMCRRRTVEKTRYRVEHEGVVWEVDEFHGANAGLVTAEVELEREDQPFSKPEWIGKEVSMDVRYANSALAVRPYRDWR
jgi:adenylate cyclase